MKTTNPGAEALTTSGIGVMESNKMLFSFLDLPAARLCWSPVSACGRGAGMTHTVEAALSR